MKEEKTKHKLARMKYNGYKRYTDYDENGKKYSYVIASWKCPICKRIVECGMPKDRKTLVVRCDGL